MNHSKPTERIYYERTKQVVREYEHDLCMILYSGDISDSLYHYPADFRPNSSYFYLTGNRDPGMVLVCLWVGQQLKRYVIVHQQSPRERRWSSGFAWNNPDEDLSGYDGYFFRDDLLRIQQFLSQYDDIDRWSSSENAPEWLTDLFPKKHDRILAKKLISRKRMIKDPYEQFLLKEAAERSAKVHAALAKNRFEAKPHENFWHADWITYGAQYNLSKQAYQPIIAGGPRACCLHYHGKTMPLNQDRYILIDAAFEYEGYTADITRVYFWKANAWDRIVYEGLLSVQKRMIEASVEGTSLPNLQIQTQYLIAELLQEWGWAQGSLEKIVVEDVAQYYPHRIGHPLGIDVHDLCDDRGLVDEPLQNGAVITIEPGIYIDPTLFPETHPAYGLGLRIEDDVLIHHNQPIVLSQLAPKEWKDVGA